MEALINNDGLKAFMKPINSLWKRQKKYILDIF